MSQLETGSKEPSSLVLTWHETYRRLEDLLGRDDPTVFKAAPGTGKTTAQFQVAYNNDLQITDLAARHDMYDDAKQMALEAGFAEDDIAVVPSPHKDCPTFRGDHGDPKAEEWRSLYRHGVSAWLLHERLNAPCQPDCPYMSNRIDNPNDYDVIIGHYTHGRDRQKIEDRTVFIDEFARSAFLTSFGNRGEADMIISEAINGYLAKEELLPWDNYGDFVANLDKENCGRIAFSMEEEELDIEQTDILEVSQSYRHHTLAPLVVYALLLAEDLGNGWHYWEGGKVSENDSSYPDSWNEVCHGPEDLVVVRKEGRSASEDEIHVLDRLDLSAADQIIGLDGTARKSLWNLVFEQDFEVEEYLTGERMLDYVTDVQDITLVTTGEGVKPYSSGNYVTPEIDASVTLWTRIEHEKPVLITPKKGGAKLKQEVPAMFANDLIPVKSGNYEFMSHGMVESNNEAAGEEALHVCGSPHPGDGVLEKWAALMGVGLTRREGVKGTDLVYEPREVGDVLHRHFVHDRITQAILRGRKENPDDDGATVVVNTQAVPDWFEPDVAVKANLQSETRRNAVRYLLENDDATTTEIADEVDADNSTIRRLLSELEDFGWVESKDNPGPNPSIWWLVD